MDFLNRAAGQLRDLFRSMPVGTQITAALMLGVVVISLVYLFRTQTTGPDSYLLGGHPFLPADMPAVQGALAQAGLNDFEVEGNLIRIPRNKQAAYIGALADANQLPTNFGDKLMSIVENQSVFASRQQQETVQKHARDAMLAKSIGKMHGIESAEVFTDSLDKRGLRNETIATATVNVRTLGSQPLATDKVRAIRSLVAGAIAGLAPDKVSVIDSNTGRHWSGEDGNGGSGLDDPYLSRKLQYEEQFKSEIQNLLSYVPGAAVSVNVELNKERSRQEESQKFDPKAVAIRQSSDETESTTESGAPGGRPGFEAQQPNRGAQLTAGAKSNSSRETRGRTETASVTSTDITRSQHVGLTPDKVTVSVVVPTTYFESIWRKRNPTAPGQPATQPPANDLEGIESEEREKIQRAVFNQIPHREEAPADLVSVTAFTPIPMATESKSLATAQALTWLSESWSTIGMLALIVFGLATLRSMMRGLQPAVQANVALATPSPGAPAPISEPAPADTTAKARLRRRVSVGPSLRDDLVELVREDPDAAANILKGWIGNVN